MTEMVFIKIYFFGIPKSFYDCSNVDRFSLANAIPRAFSNSHTIFWQRVLGMFATILISLERFCSILFLVKIVFFLFRNETVFNDNFGL
ncbi:hypothetical protein DB895_05155 [Flavobacterium psychrotolerans]|uniref:Uncharacterized protein n=1 Tax=Flavobacterium psychrotolerans TaxID=2169410 RepID=A0A2U1JLD8_9FLAO|nr:hypothetical protein DB895_05155 [Flavobacterium psychrotolerans]